MRTRLIILALFFSTCGYAQQDSTTDKGISLTSFVYNWADSVYSLSDQNEFELRMQSFSHLKGDLQFFIFSRKGGVCRARMFAMKISDTSFYLHEIPPKKDASSLWKKMRRDLFDLNGLENFRKIVDQDTTWALMDGKIYSFQIITPQGQRQFYYHSPEVYAKHFRKVKDFAKAGKVIACIYNQFYFYSYPK